MKMQQEMMALYKKNKVNPAAGCLPILIQIPIFFSLYKVIFVTIELYHAPWIGWIRDLSSPDPDLDPEPLRPAALRGARDHGSPLHIISLGVLPILLGISMWLQQKLNPAPTDATQAMIFAWMPWVFMFMLGTLRLGAGAVLDHQQHHHLHPAIPDHAQPRAPAGHLRQHPLELRRRRAAAGGVAACRKPPKKPAPPKK